MEPKLLCNHCGNNGIHSIIVNVKESEFIHLDDEQSFYEEFDIVLVRCEYCKKHSLFSLLNGNFDESWSLYPNETQIEDVVPNIIRDAYIEAKKVKHFSNIAFIVMIRRALELLCKIEKANGKDLYNKIKDLGNRDIIPVKLSEMADAIRLFGNDNVHDNKINITRNEIEILDYFYLAILDYIYIAPFKIRKIKEKLL